MEQCDTPGVRPPRPQFVLDPPEGRNDLLVVGLVGEGGHVGTHLAVAIDSMVADGAAEQDDSSARRQQAPFVDLAHRERVSGEAEPRIAGRGSMHDYGA